METKLDKPEKESKTRKDQVARSMSLVPRFVERYIEEYFLMFENVTKTRDWPKYMYFCSYKAC